MTEREEERARTVARELWRALDVTLKFAVRDRHTIRDVRLLAGSMSDLLNRTAWVRDEP